MKMIDKFIKFYFMGVVLAPLFLYADVESDIRSSLTNLCSQIPDRDKRNGVPIEGALQFREESAYAEINMLMSNHWSVAFPDLPSFATNSFERKVLMASSVAFDDRHYIDCLEMLTGLAESNAVSLSELRWVQNEVWKKPLVGSALVNGWQTTRVSNLVERLLRYTGNTNLYSKILDGSAKREFDAAYADGLWE